MTYRFSPITTEHKLREAVLYISTQTSLLCEEAIGHALPMHSLTVFAHYPDEYEYLSKLLLTLGSLHNENNGPRVVLHVPIIIGRNHITHLRIRKPDPERPQVGCNDFEVGDYGEFKDRNLENSPRLRLITRPEYEMIEFHDPDFDVLAYVVSR